MNKYNFFIPVIMFISVLTSCVNDDFTKPDNHINTTYGKTIDDDAIENINEFLSGMGESTRSLRDIESVEPIYVNNTRSTAADTLLYVINFNDYQGYAIIDAKSSNEIYAISPEGKLNISDITNFEPLRELVFSYLFNSYSKENNVRSNNDETYAKVALNVPPKLNRFVSYWHQKTPYNSFCPLISPGTRATVGCRTLSLAMVLSFYEWPRGKYYTCPLPENEKYYFNWSIYKDEHIASSLRISNTARMLAFMRDSILHGEVVAPDGSTHVDDTNLENGIKTLGYSSKKVFNSAYMYDRENDLVRFLENGDTIGADIFKAAPVMIKGNKERVENVQMAHQWVIDAVVQRALFDKKTDKEIPGSRISFFRCVWGWYPNVTGYYRYLPSNMGDPQSYIPLRESSSLLGEKGTSVVGNAYIDWEIIGGLMPIPYGPITPNNHTETE